MKQIIVAFILLVLTLQLNAQRDSSWSVMLLWKGNKAEIKPDMESFSKTGFYLYKNCIYEFDLKNETHIMGRLVNIKRDTLYFNNFFNKEAAKAANSAFLTTPVYYKDLDKLCLVEDRAMGMYNKYSLSDFDFIFKKDTTRHSMKSEWVQMYSNDTAKFEIVRNLTAQGIGGLYEMSGQTYFYYGYIGIPKPDSSKIKHTYRTRNVFWFTPCGVEEINGLALGLHAKNIKNEDFNMRDTLVIRGLDLEINPWEIFGLPAILENFNGPCPDSINIYNNEISRDWQVKIHGVQISLVASINEMRLEGFNLTGAFTIVDEIKGVSISGINNFSYIMHGISIAAISNRAAEARGLQVGLINKSADLRGIQIGLWNINAKRSLPFINWQFKPAKKKKK